MRTPNTESSLRVTSDIESAITCGIITCVLVAFTMLAVWAWVAQNERYHQCRLTHAQDYCMWRLK